jgi:hypothetical protein
LATFGCKIGHFCVRNPNTEFLNLTAILFPSHGLTWRLFALEIFGRKIGRFCVRNPNTEFFNFTANFEQRGSEAAITKMSTTGIEPAALRLQEESKHGTVTLSPQALK